MMTNGNQFTSAAISDRGLSESRPQNEDSYVELKQYGLFVVADGVGGAQAGEVASQMAVEIIGEAFINISSDADPEDTMRIAIERANGAIYQMSRDLPQLASMATTVVALHIAGDIATLAHVGDSRIYRVDSNGKISRETDDHSVVEDEVRAGRMTSLQASVHPSRNVISRAVGAEDTVDPDIKMMIVHPATTFLLCSDGITRHIEDAEIQELLASDNAPSEICTQMKDLCYGRGAEDNLTAVIIKFPAATHDGANADSEKEQVTIASARSPFDSTVDEANDSGISEDTIDISTEIEMAKTIPADEFDLTLEDFNESSEKHDDGAYLLENPDEIFADEPSVDEPDSYTSSKVVVPAKEHVTSVPTPKELGSDKNHLSPSKGTLSNAVSAIMLLIVGGFIGFASAYFLLGSSQPPPVQVAEAPVITEMKSNNTALTAFEEGRRQVDTDPAKYIAVNPSPQVAEDYFLLARAFLLTGKYWDAKRFYGMARDRLSQVETSNSKTLSAEIAMALAIIDSPKATEEFAKQVAVAGSVPSLLNANNNTVVDSSVNAPQPIR